LHTGNNYIVVDDIPRDVISEDDLFFAPPGENWLYPFVFCHTISELYEKINALWTEQQYDGSAFLIKYDGRLNYPTAIQIKNIYNSGYDYLVQVTVNELDRDHIDDDDGPPWGGVVITNFEELERWKTQNPNYRPPGWVSESGIVTGN
jgi:hypothetical protein